MPRLLLATCLLLALAFATQAEEPLTQPIQKKEEALKLEEENGKKVLRLAGEQEVSVIALLRAWVEVSGQQLFYQSNQLQAFKCTIASPEAGKSYDAAGIEELACDALSQFRLCLVEFTPGRFRVVMATEVMSDAPIVSRKQLETAPVYRWVTLKYWSRTAGRQAMLNAALNDKPRSGMPSIPVGNWAFFCNRADKLREMVAVLDEAEKSAEAREIRLYETPGRVSPLALAKAMNALNPEDSLIPPVAVSVLGSTRLLLVLGLPEHQALVPDLLKKLGDLPMPVVSPDAPSVLNYELPESADTATVVAALEKLFGEINNRPTIVAVPGKKIIVARADDAEHKQISEFIELLK